MLIDIRTVGMAEIRCHFDDLPQTMRMVCMNSLANEHFQFNIKQSHEDQSKNVALLRDFWWSQTQKETGSSKVAIWSKLYWSELPSQDSAGKSLNIQICPSCGLHTSGAAFVLLYWRFCLISRVHRLPATLLHLFFR